MMLWRVAPVAVRVCDVDLWDLWGNGVAATREAGRRADALCFLLLGFKVRLEH
jgi:hypothetical protein